MKQNVSFYIPSKTFLIGEYLALEQHCGIVLNTLPCFEFHVTSNSAAEDQALFSKNSPADIYFQDNHELFKQYNYDFIDPYQKSGGFGASSAQFVALARLKHFIEHNSQDLLPHDIKQIHQDYLNVIEKNNSRASGIDVIGQCLKKIAFIDCKQDIYQTHDWPFENLSFLLFKTPFKIRTHEHVGKVKNIPSVTLKTIFDKTCEAFIQRDQDTFLSSVQHYAHILQQHDLILKEITDFCFLLSKKFPQAIVKGCGALGADVLLVLIESHQKDALKKWIAQYDMKFVADEESLKHESF